MLAGVVSVRKQTREEFREAVKVARASASKLEGLLAKPDFHEDGTPSGDRRAYLAVYEKHGLVGPKYISMWERFRWRREGRCRRCSAPERERSCPGNRWPDWEGRTTSCTP